MKKIFAVFLAISFITPTSMIGEARREWESNPEIERAIQKGLRYLVNQQAPDGSFSNNGQYKMAMTSLSGIAFLSAGSTPERGAYSDQLNRILEFILAQAHKPSFKKNGFLTTPNEGQPMYGHGFGLLFLAQVYGTISDPEKAKDIKSIMYSCVRCISRAQSKDGGWYYSPNSAMDEGSVTVTQLQALRAAQDVGIAVSETVINRSIDYLVKSQADNGSIRYSLRMGGNRGTPALTAAGLACFFNCGIYGGEQVDKGMDFVDKSFQINSGAKGVLAIRGHFMYTHQYASQVYFYIGGERWKNYFNTLTNHLLKIQTKNGSWTANPGPAYSTPVAIMILTLPYRLLPINQR